MLNQISNFFSLLTKANAYTENPDPDSVIAVGVPDKRNKFKGKYKPVMTKLKHLVSNVIVSPGIGITVNQGIGPNGETIYTINNAGGSTVSYSTVYFVDPFFGNNGTALAGRFDKPYQTISGAVAIAGAAAASSTNRILIYIRRGNYSGNVDLKNWVDFYCEPGVIFTGSGSVRDAGIAVVSNFFGYAKFLSKTATTFFITGSSTVTFEFDGIDNPNGQCLRFEPPIGGQCDLTLNGNYITGRNIGVGYAIAPRRKCNVVMNIKNFIRAPHSVFDIRDSFDGLIVVNCPKLILAAENIYGGNFKQAIIMYSSTVNGRFVFNGNIINEGIGYPGGIAGMVTNWSSTSGIIEVNGNIYAGDNVGIYASGNQVAGRVATKGNIFSNIQPVYVASENSCSVRDGVISKPGVFVANAIRTIQNAKLYLTNVHIYHEAADIPMINLDSVTSQLFLYNVVGESVGPAALSITAVGPINIKSHGSRFNSPLGPNVTDVLTPSGIIVDPLVVVPKF